MLNFKRIATISLMSLATVCASAQFYQTGDDPASLKWKHFKTPEFHLIYAEGQDSLAWEYASALERWRLPVSGSIGLAPNESYRGRMPVILHPLTAMANGSVTWAPRRMDLYTVPDAYNPEPLPWISTLAIHESRHVAQLQFVNHGKFRPGSLIFGEMFGGALSAVYGGPAFFEGDAVAVETALTSTGRGRKADFLEYPMVALDNGDWRDWYGWRYSSIKRYTPDHYKVGYMSVAGMRTVYDEPLFSAKYYERVFRNRGVPFNVMGKIVKEVSGKKPRASFRDIEEAFLEDWRKGFEERRPFMPMDTVTATPRRYAEFTGIAMAGDDMYAIHKGMEQGPTLARITAGGKVKDLRPFAAVTSALQWSATLGRLFWSENVADRRWSLGSSSLIRYMDPSEGKIRNLTDKGRLFHPAPEPEGDRIAVTGYAFDSRSSILVLDGLSGETLEQFVAPDSLQIVESAWSGSDIYVTAISECGIGIYRAGAVFSEIVSPLPVTIRQLRGAAGGCIAFVSDRSGVNEIYSLNVSTGAIEQLTCSRYGVADFAFSEGERELYYSALAPEARYICRTEASDLPRAAVDFCDIHHYAIADKLSAQEQALTRQTAAPEISTEPETWHKGAHLFHFHSWLVPFCVNYDAIQELSIESVASSASPGATAFFQNALGTSYGSVSYSFVDDSQTWRHGAHVKFNYCGLYPVFEANMDFNDGVAGQYQLYQVHDADNSVFYARSLSKSKTPSLSGDLRVYVPLNFSSGGWIRGIVPQVRYAVSNSIFSTSMVKVVTAPATDGDKMRIFNGYVPGDNILMHRLAASVRGYCMRPVAEAGVYPRFGIGAEAGITGRIGLTDFFTPAAFFDLYGYLPGLIPQHGLKISALAQHQFGKDLIFGEDYVACTPRGLQGISSMIGAYYPSKAKLSADYRMAVAPVDWTWPGRLAYIRNFEVTGHFDLGVYDGSRTKSLSDRGSVYSAGADACAVLGNFMWIPYDTRIGVTFSYNGGSLYGSLTEAGAKTGRTYVGATFSVDL